jgi:hypothetical protein
MLESAHLPDIVDVPRGSFSMCAKVSKACECIGWQRMGGQTKTCQHGHRCFWSDPSKKTGVF